MENPGIKSKGQLFSEEDKGQIEMICRYDEEGKLSYVNMAYAEALDLKPHELIGKSFYAFIPDHEQKRVKAYVNALFNKAVEPRSFVQLRKGKNGIEQWQEWYDLPMEDSQGKIYEIHAIGHDISKRKKLEADQARMDKIVRESYNEIYLFNDPALDFLYANASALKNIGYTLQELKNLKFCDLFFYPDEMALSALLKPLRMAETDRVKIQLRHRRKDGSYYDVEALIQVHERNHSFVAIESDISEKLVSERKLLETIREKETLLKEIHHRVKNNLQLISSIIYLRMASLEPSEMKTFLENTRQKIRSIALIHERLLQSKELNKVEISDYLGNLIQDLKIGYGRQDLQLKFHTDLQTCVMNIDTAIICGLLVNELVTNAIKHAFKGRSAGTIGIVFHSIVEENKFLLEVSDNGVSLPEDMEPGNASSFGMQLLDVFTKQLHGRLEIFRENGTTFRIYFKANF